MKLMETSTATCNQALFVSTATPATGLRFILVETSRPGNIGAAARAMKTMGFSDLVLVNPRFADAAGQPEAVAFASGAQDVLLAARVVGSIDEALEGCNFAAAVSARLREFSPPVIVPRTLAERLAAASASESASESASAVVSASASASAPVTPTPMRAAVVFGNERFGLPNEIVEKCNVLINIPANPDYSSLNLAQAVQVIAYECRVAATAGQLAAPGVASTIGFQGEAAGLAQIDAMFGHLEEALVAIAFLDPQ
ncbi:MAG: RNA methyltransferase, partial [Herminiimonas sp.]|nr:RNA methyltransferase [Herminiimonas sp.]